MNKQRYLSVSHKQSVITLLLIFFLFFSAITFIKLPTVKATQTTTANGMTITNPADITMSTLAELVSGQQFNLFVEIGDWHPDHTINYYDSNAYYTSRINLIHSYDSRFKVYAWVSWNHEGTGNIDISQSSYRSLMYNAITACVNKGFDGFMDDLEPFAYSSGITNIIGSWSDYVTYLNGVNTAVHNAGSNKISSASLDTSYATATACDDTIYSDTTLDYAMPMFYNNEPITPQSVFQNRMDQILTESNSPVIMQIAGGFNPPLTTQLPWIDQQIATHGPYSKLAGFSIFSMEDITNSEWTSWNNWATKNVYFSQPTPVDPTPTFSNSTVTVTNMALQQSFVESGFPLPINVTLQNMGSSAETMQVQLIATSPPNISTLIQTETVTLDSGKSITLNCTIANVTLPIGNYTIAANALSLSSQPSRTNSLSTTIGVTYAVDLNGDFKIDSSDFFAFLNAYNTYWSTGKVNPVADFNHDGKIDFEDFAIFVGAYNDYWSQK